LRRGQDGRRDGAGTPSRRPRGRRTALVGCLVIWLLALAGVARADPLAGYEIQTTRATVAADGVAVDVTASCTAGKVVVGGGFHGGADLKVYSSEPADGLGGASDHSWNVLVRNDGPFDEPITVTAVCVSGPPAGYGQIRKTVNVGVDTGIQPVAAACPAGQEVVGGGFHISTPDLVKVFGSEPTAGTNISPVQWTALVRNDDPSAPQPVTATAICVDAAALSGYAEPSSRVVVAHATFADVVAGCPQGDKVLSGGFDVETPDDITVLSSEPTDASDALSDHEWSSQVTNSSQTLDRQTTVTAICAAAPTLAPTVTGVSPSTGTVNGGTTVTITGSDFTGATAVDFGDGVAPAFHVDSSTQITATSPPGSGSVEVVVTTPGGTSTPNPPADQFTYLPEPTIATNIDQAGPLALGDTFTDTASVTYDGPTPTGTVTFDVFGPNSGSECFGPPMFTDTEPLTDGTATSSPFTGTDAGGYQVVAHYSGDSTYAPTTSNCFDESESISVSQATPQLTTQVSQDPIAVGAALTDTATLAPVPPGATPPTGTVTFDVYGPDDNTGCDTTPALSSTASVDASGTAVSDPLTPTSPGLYTIVASYSGDGSYAPASTGCGDETVNVTMAGPAIATQVSAASIDPGGSFDDTATLTTPPSNFAPTGTVTFSVYGPDDPTCSTEPVLDPVRNLDGSTVNSGSLTPPSPGTYRVIASYSGDNRFAPSTTACGDPNETVVVGLETAVIASAVSSTPITLGQGFHDTATLAPPAGAPAPTGNVTFTVFSTPDCTGPPAFTSTTALNAAGTAAVSGDFTPTAAGTYHAIASYPGDTDYNAVATGCGDPGENVVVDRTAAPISTQVSAATIVVGSAFSDTARLTPPAGAPAPTGNVTFTVYGPADPSCAADPLFASTVPVGPSGTTAVSDPLTPGAPGTYRAIATYSGDPNYAGTSTACGDPGEAVVVRPAAPTLTTAVSAASIGLGGSFHDTATLGGIPPGAPVPSGTVTFDVYRPGDPTCAAAPVLTSTNPVDAAGTAAISGTFTPTSAGTYRVIAAYAGDANYAGSASSCADPTEAVAVTRATLAISTQVAPATIGLGASFHDTATIGPVPTGAPAPTGTVTFDVYGPGDPSCSSEPALTASTAVGATVTSTDFTPASAGTYRVVATYGGDANYTGSASSCTDPTEAVVVNFPPPAVTELAPQAGPEAGGTQVTITGTNLAGATAVDFGTAAATGLTVNPAGTQLTATAPPGTGTVGVTVVTPSGTAPAGRYTYLSASPPVVAAVTPASGLLGGGNGVVVFGSGLSGATSVRFGGVAVAVASVNAAGTELTTVAPPGTGTVDVTVTTPLGGTSATTTADRYTYVAAPPPPPAPTVAGLTPASGPAAGGTTVTIAGSSFAGATAVGFGGTPAAAFTVDGPNQITATAPAGSGTVDVTVTTPGGTSATGAADQYAYAAAPGSGGSGSGSGAGGTTGGGPSTSPAPPKSETGAPKVISSSSAEFTATINPQGLSTTMHFEYTAAGGGATTAAVTYDTRTPEQAVGSDFADHTVTATVANLLPNSTYHVRAVATNSSGVTPGTDTTFKTATDPPPPPPVLGKSVNATPVSGTVLVILPGQGHISSAGAHASAVKGVGFIPLTEARQLPVGTIFDTSRGVARLTSATAVKGTIQSGDFAAGVFKLLQDRRQKGLTELDLVEGKSTTAKCAAPVGKAQTAAKRALPKTVLNLLRATAKGKFKTRGKYSSATVRGTTWTTSDRCDGTLTAVKRGVVVVSDLRRKRQIVLRAGRAYLAKAP
jgi:hypothetical protein